MRTKLVAALATVAAVGLAVPAATASVVPTADPPTPSVTATLAEGLGTPWGLAFLPDGSALVSDRDSAKIYQVKAEGGSTEVGTVDGVVPDGEGGLLGLAVAPTFDQDHFVYAYYTAEGDNRVVRMPFENGSLGEQEVLVEGIDKAGRHNGGRIAFGPDGLLYIGTGDAANTDTSQNPDSLNGKILRVTPEGEPAPDNPSGTAVWTLGHRNVQGLAWDADGRMWASELGQDAYDELNLIEGGKNYGWPECEGDCDNPDFVNPKATWATSEASPSGLTFAKDTLWMCALRGERLWGIPVAGGDLNGDPKEFFTGEHGRLRAIMPHSDGSLWLLTNSDGGKVLKLELQ